MCNNILETSAVLQEIITQSSAEKRLRFTFVFRHRLRKKISGCK